MVCPLSIRPPFAALRLLPVPCHPLGIFPSKVTSLPLSSSVALTSAIPLTTLTGGPVPFLSRSQALLQTLNEKVQNTKIGTTIYSTSILVCFYTM